MPLSNVLLDRPQSSRLHSLSYGELIPAAVWMPPGLFSSKPIGNPVVETPSAQRRFGVTNHVSETNRNTDWAYALKMFQTYLRPPPPDPGFATSEPTSSSP